MKFIQAKESGDPVNQVGEVEVFSRPVAIFRGPSSEWEDPSSDWEDPSSDWEDPSSDWEDPSSEGADRTSGLNPPIYQLANPQPCWQSCF